MASENVIAQVHKGMEVHTADGQKLGKVAEIWLGTDPTATNPRCDEELCSRLEVHSGAYSSAACCMCLIARSGPLLAIR